jgi:FdhE protein
MADAGNPWERRLARAEHLEREWPFASATLAFYRRVAALQRDVSLVAIASQSRSFKEFSLDQLDPFVGPFLERVAVAGPPPLARKAVELMEGSEQGRRAWVIGSRGLSDRRRRWAALGPPAPFFGQVLLQPVLEALPLERKRGARSGSCPHCGSEAIAMLLREADPRRALVCSLCLREWEFATARCPGCGEEGAEKRRLFESAEVPGIRIYACDSCRRYLKAIDLAMRPDAEPVVDELASNPLDVLARDKGYAKIVPNFAGA